MIARILIVLLPLLFLSGCSKDKAPERGSKTSKSTKSGLSKYILDEAPKIEHPLDIEFGGKVTLLGYDIEPAGVIPQSKKVTLTLYWRLNQKLDGNWKLMTHVLDGLGDRVLDLYDRSPIRKGPRGRPALRPSSWSTGKVYVDRLTFQLPKQMKSDKIKVIASVYSNGQTRMPVSKGPMHDRDFAVVASFNVGLEGKSKELVVPTLSLEVLEDGTKITVDGRLSEPAWETAPVLGPFVDSKTGEADKAAIGAKARLLWNDQALYVGFEVEDKKLAGGFPAGKRDSELWTKDAVGLLVDPDAAGDGRNYYEIAVGPQNLVFDSQFDVEKKPKATPGAGAGFPNWTSTLKSAVTLKGTLDKDEDEDEGYVVELMIPWKSFGRAQRVPPALGDKWRMNLYATEGSGRVSWSAVFGAGNLHETSRFGSVMFTKKGFTPPPPASATPSASASAAPAASASAGKTATAPSAAAAKSSAAPKPTAAAKPAATPQ